MSQESTLVIGGCRSGKSDHALLLANQVGRQGKIFVATCVPKDKEMFKRVDKHQKERGQEWQTIEAPLNVPQILGDYGRDASVILIDCLTLWTSNLLMQKEDIDYINIKVKELAAAVTQCPCPVIMVTNEVGLGIVPENPLARLFRDAAGTVNQTMAKVCKRVIMTVAGIAVTIK